MPETRSNDTQEPGAAPAPPATLATTTKAAPAAAAERQSNQSPRYNSVNQVRVKQTRDQVFDFDVYGAYLQTIIKSIVPAC